MRTRTTSQDFELPASLGFQLNRAARQMGAALSEQLSPLGLTTAQWAVLAALKADPGIPQQQLGTQLGTDPATLAELLRRLEARGLVRRDRDTNDARRYLVFAGDVDPDDLDAAAAAAQSVNDTAVRGFSASEVETLRRALARVSENLESA